MALAQRVRRVRRREHPRLVQPRLQNVIFRLARHSVTVPAAEHINQIAIINKKSRIMRDFFINHCSGCTDAGRR